MYSYALVAAQFFLAGMMLYWAEGITRSLPAAAVFAAGLALGLWALRHNRPGNFNIRPDIKQGCGMVEGGPYRYIRHPMYASVLGMMAGVLVSTPTWRELAAFVLLVAVLALKARREERLWCNHHPGYDAYKKRTGMFLPFLF